VNIYLIPFKLPKKPIVLGIRNFATIVAKQVRKVWEGNMEIKGMGSEIVECVRIGKMIQQHGELFLTRVYCEKEILFCQRRARALEYFTGFWAIKEATLKSMGYAGQGLSRTLIEIVMNIDPRPVIQLHGSAKLLARTAGVGDFIVSLAHCRNYATSTVIAVENSITRGKAH